MKTYLRKCFVMLALLALRVVDSHFSIAHAQGTTAFTYQGQLRDNGTNANGTYTMTFNLYDMPSGGSLIGGPLSTTTTLVNGLFTVNLDFGNAFNGNARYLDIAVQSGSDSEELSPRVQVLPTPYAQFAAVAATVTNGAITSAKLAANAVATTNIQNGAVTSQQIANNTITSLQLRTNSVYADNIAPGQVVKGLAAGNNTVIFPLGTDAGMISSLVPNIQIFTASGAFIVPTNATRIMVEAWGGGGGGGGGYAYQDLYGNIYDTDGGGGGGGAFAEGVFDVTNGSVFSVIVGSGGMYGSVGEDGSDGIASSFGNFLTALPGEGGTAGSMSNGGNGGDGGSMNVVNASEFTIRGNSGDSGNGTGNGGPSPRGGEAAPGAYGVNGDQPNQAFEGGFPGGGGGGGSGGVNGATAGTGGNGANGMVVIYY